MSKLIGPFVRRNCLPYHKVTIFQALCTGASHTVSMVKENKCNPLSYCRFYCSEKKDASKLTKVKSTEVGISKTFKQVKETTKTASYLGVILAGVGVTAVIFYQVFQELFSNKSSNSVYTTSLKKCCKDPRVIDSLGEPIKGFGEETRRGRRRHVSHLFYERDGINFLRMKYYIQGSRKRGTVHLEMRENDKGDFDYRYLFVQLEDYPRNVIIIEDNRYDKQMNFDKPFDIV
ncbi:mitochondrial import inner membrane translocase subunit Tim21 isoform X1 [Zootermopsis nevadensis]|uniref:Mitochondrial import inner membrane translocase subunit Tim21 n=1 Tax=Zootermopsis nevadensis TaxID=136037 RepID=A0A067R1F8_ZOONE|nr:mitochondrial import inner membrane translocase subunit Tim21 isoform X1 [Zootermopsis nevadensis]XP_021925076.1 mitochondrial import inner membrane translocase subunit Tim21 isoform X1 [Zootermopsis nevadensis]XP_021925077.1 mitochondrial import inner membrane translocase subunit Tim21 isoform X1 [Zootermopsis nevadensis]KDR16646.1 TIM21-like protein, mitochondrial [Zootermopsis nevadensis]